MLVKLIGCSGSSCQPNVQLAAPSGQDTVSAQRTEELKERPPHAFLVLCLRV